MTEHDTRNGGIGQMNTDDSERPGESESVFGFIQGNRGIGAVPDTESERLSVSTFECGGGEP